MLASGEGGSKRERSSGIKIGSDLFSGGKTDEVRTNEEALMTPPLNSKDREIDWCRGEVVRIDLVIKFENVAAYEIVFDLNFGGSKIRVKERFTTEWWGRVNNEKEIKVRGCWISAVGLAIKKSIALSGGNLVFNFSEISSPKMNIFFSESSNCADFSVYEF